MKVKRTFMEISGFPHYENVCSNILAFFFDPHNEHDLRDLLLRSLADCIEIPELAGLCDGVVSVQREMQTNKGGRIDICLETNGHVVGIENKIHHWLANDLADYWDKISSLAALHQQKTPLGVILSLHRFKSPHEKFRSITFSQLQESVETRLGAYVTRADPNYLQLLMSFFKTLQNVKGTAMDKHEFEFFVQHHQDIEELLKGHKRFEMELLNKTGALGGMVFGEALPPRVRHYIWKGDLSCVYFADFNDSVCLRIDTFVGPTGWDIVFHCRERVSDKVRTISKAPPGFFSFIDSLASIEQRDDSNYRFMKMDINHRVDQVAATLRGLIETVLSQWKERQLI